MRCFARHSVLRRTVALILTAISTAGCMTWRPAANDASYVTAQQPGRVRATLVNGDRVVVAHPEIVGSQLLGYSGTVPHTTHVAIPMKQVKSIEVPQLAPGRTLLLIVVVALVVGAASASWEFSAGLGGILAR